jgi:hypothetical protein
MLKEEWRLRMFKSKVLRGVFGLEREEVMGGWRKLQKRGDP